MMENTPEWQTYIHWLSERGLTQPRWRDDVDLADLAGEAAPEAQEPEAPTNPLAVVFLSDVPMDQKDAKLVAKMAAALRLADDQWRLTACIPETGILADGIPPADVLDRLGEDTWKYVPPAKTYVAFGPLATRIACGKGSFRTMRGHRQVHRDRAVMPTYHPRDLAKHPELKREVWTDLQKCTSESSL